MTTKTEELPTTVNYEDDGHGNFDGEDDKTNNLDDDDDNHGGSSDDEEDEEEILEAEYEKYREDQMNTGVIAALLGGFALTNSWEMEVGEGTVDAIDLAAYTLAILSVHGCTCSALASAFLYRSMTQKTPRAGVRWMKKHYVLARLPWCKFMGGTFCYIVSVILVAWSTLETNAMARRITFFAGVCGCMLVLYTCWVIWNDSDGPDYDISTPHAASTANNKSTNHRRKTPQKRLPNSRKRQGRNFWTK